MVDVSEEIWMKFNIEFRCCIISVIRNPWPAVLKLNNQIDKLILISHQNFYIYFLISRIANKNYKSIDYCKNNSHGSQFYASFYDERKNGTEIQKIMLTTMVFHGERLMNVFTDPRFFLSTNYSKIYF